MISREGQLEQPMHGHCSTAPKGRRLGSVKDGIEVKAEQRVKFSLLVHKYY